MPEGPEVASSADHLAVVISGQLIVRIKVKFDHKVSWQIDQGKIEGSTVLDVISIGKKLIVILRPIGQQKTRYYLISSFGMSGSWRFREAKHIVISLVLSDHQGKRKSLHFNDPRRFGNLIFTDEPGLNRVLARIGRDLIREDLPRDDWEQILNKGQRRLVGQFLLDQDLIAGIGNYLRSDILYLARLHPDRKISSLTDFEKEILRKACIALIQESYYHNGHTMSDYILPNGDPGSYQCYTYHKKFCPLNYSIEKIEFRKRAVFIVPELQISQLRMIG